MNISHEIFVSSVFFEFLVEKIALNHLPGQFSIWQAPLPTLRRISRTIAVEYGSRMSDKYLLSL